MFHGIYICIPLKEMAANLKVNLSEHKAFCSNIGGFLFLLGLKVQNLTLVMYLYWGQETSMVTLSPKECKSLRLLWEMKQCNSLQVIFEWLRMKNTIKTNLLYLSHIISLITVNKKSSFLTILKLSKITCSCLDCFILSHSQKSQRVF